MVRARASVAVDGACERRAEEGTVERVGMVAAHLRPMCPDLPIPVMTTRPRDARTASQAMMNVSSSDEASTWSAAASVLITSTPRSSIVSVG